MWHLGIVKRLVTYTFDIEITNKDKSNMPFLKDRLPSDCLDDVLCKVKTPTEFQRVTRRMRWATVKAIEYRNLLAFYSTIIIE